jgi:hypothetical protein
MPAERERSPLAAAGTQLSRVLRPGTGRAPVPEQRFPNTLLDYFTRQTPPKDAGQLRAATGIQMQTEARAARPLHQPGSAVSLAFPP